MGVCNLVCHLLLEVGHRLDSDVVAEASADQDDTEDRDDGQQDDVLADAEVLRTGSHR